MDRARRSHRQLEALIAKLEDRMASLEQRESELQYDLNTSSLPYISTSDDPTSSDRIPPRPTPRPRTNPERGGYPRGPQSRNFIDLLEDEIRRFQLEKQEADIKWQKRQKELLTQLQSIRSDFLPEPEYSRSVDSIQSADIENIQRLNRLAEEVSQKKRRVAELERQLHEKVKQAPPSPEQGVLMQRAPGQSLRPRLSSTSLAQLHRIMRELENFICAIEEEDYKAADQLPVPSEGPRTATSAMGGDDATQDMIRLQQKEIENLKQQLASVTNNYMVAKQESDNMRQELNELKHVVTRSLLKVSRVDEKEDQKIMQVESVLQFFTY
ncbi:uncharacterized protein [Anabrus simplex]